MFRESFQGYVNKKWFRVIKIICISHTGELRREATDHVEIVAIKVLKDLANKKAEEDFMREVDIMSAFRHENILTLIGVVLRGNYRWTVKKKNKKHTMFPIECHLNSIYVKRQNTFEIHAKIASRR